MQYHSVHFREYPCMYNCIGRKNRKLKKHFCTIYFDTQYVRSFVEVNQAILAWSFQISLNYSVNLNFGPESAVLSLQNKMSTTQKSMFQSIQLFCTADTAGFMKTVASVYTLLMNTFYPTVHRQLREPFSGYTPYVIVSHSVISKLI